MKRKFFTAVLVLALAVLSFGASKQNDEIKRMGIFISNFTEAGLFNFDLEEDGTEDAMHFGDPAFNIELLRFGITHNVINNPKSTIKNCPNKKCGYGKNIISGQAVAASVRKYFDLKPKHEDIVEESDNTIAWYDGKNYHINAADWRPETVYYAEVQEVSRRKGVITMSGELYNLRNKKDRPATFTATAKPHEWNDKDTWAILSLNVQWN